MGLRKDYHGGRRYASGPADEGGPAAWLKARLRSIFRPKSWPLSGTGGGSFSLLGDEDHRPGRPVFPMGDLAVRSRASHRIERRTPGTDSSAGRPDPANR